MAKSSGTKPGKTGSKATMGAATDKLAELAANPLARSMLAAGLVAAAAALTTNQKVRQGAKKASREAIDGAEAAADNASKIGAAIVSAATDAVRRMMSTAARSGTAAKPAAKAKPAKKSAAARKTRAAKPAAKPKAAGRPKAAAKLSTPVTRSAAAEPKVPAKRGRKPGSKNKPGVKKAPTPTI